MIRFTSLLFLISIFFSCENSSHSTIRDKEKNKDYKYIHLDFIDRRLQIPKHYKQITLEELQDRVKTANQSTHFLEIIKRQIGILQEEDMKYALFGDQKGNYFWIANNEYVQFGNDIARSYAHSYHNFIKQESYYFNLGYEGVDKSYMETKHSNIVKVKYIQTHEDFKRHQTNYVITTGFKTFIIMVSNYEDIDYEVLIRRIG